MTQFELSETKSNKNNRDTPILHFQYFQYFPFSTSSEAQWQRVHNTYVDRSNVQTQCLRPIFMIHKRDSNKPSNSIASPTHKAYYSLLVSWARTKNIQLECLVQDWKKFFFFFGARSFGTTCAVGKGPNQTTLLLLVWLLRQKRAQIWTWERDADFWCIARGSDKENSSSSLLVTDL